MSFRSLLLLAVAACLAFGAATVLRHQLSAAKAPPVRALVAKIEIPKGSFVQASKHFDWADWSGRPTDATTLLEGTFDPEKLNGAVARRVIGKGEPIAESALVKSSEGGFMAAVLETGKRAVSIAVDATSGNAGFIFPGDRVDLIVTHHIQGPKSDVEQAQPNQTLASETFVEDLRVLAVDQTVNNADNTAILAKTVTLEVTPGQAEKINVAKDLGKISLSLRSLSSSDVPSPVAAPEAAGPGYARDSDISKILNPASDVAVKVDVFRGDKHEQMEFDRH